MNVHGGYKELMGMSFLSKCEGFKGFAPHFVPDIYVSFLPVKLLLTKDLHLTFPSITIHFVC